MTGCRLCDWRPAHNPDSPGPLSQLADHAVDSGHPVCLVCGRSLTSTELRTCESCVAEVRRLLVEVVQLFALLPMTLGHPVGARYDADSPHGGSDERPLPGGDALVMLGPGSMAAGALGLPSDPPAVAAELGGWEDDWRSTRREPAADCEATVAGAAAYLSDRAGWSASHHDAFDEFVTDLRRITARLRDATAMSDRPQLGVPCFDCGADLRRAYGEDDYRCPRCRRTYDEASYWLAVRANLEQEASGA